MKASSVGLSVALVSGTCLLLACSSSDPGNPQCGGAAGSASGYLSVTGTLDAASGKLIDGVLAVSRDAYITATLSGGTFDLSLPKGSVNLLIFLNGSQVVGLLKANVATDLDCLPIWGDANCLDLGTIALNTDTKEATGTVTQGDLLAALGLNLPLAERLGAMDNEMLVLSSLDVDRDGLLDGPEVTTHFDFAIRYQFDAGSFASILDNWGGKDNVSPKGYTFNFWADREPSGAYVPWNSATMHSPQDINGSNDTEQCALQEGYNDAATGLWFFCDWTATNPVAAPMGSYAVLAGSKTFTFQNVASIAPNASADDVYVPFVKLSTDGGGQVTELDWQWWRRTNGVWVAATDDELIALIGETYVTIGSADNLWLPFPLGSPNGPYPPPWRPSATGSLTVPTGGWPPGMTFVPASLSISYETTFGQLYEIDWR